MSKTLDSTIIQSMESYLEDPADTNFQRGHLACLMELYHQTARAYFFDEELERLEKQTLAVETTNEITSR
jgi:hypothetical protein